MITYISDKDINNLNISPLQSMAWVEEAFLLKSSSLLPHKISITFDENKFFNTMPAIIPSLNAMGVKIVDRYPDRIPTIDGQILFYNYKTGNLTHILDAAWITNARTGAVCAMAVKTLAVKNFSTIAIMGLGNTAKSSMFCILEDNKNRPLKIKLLRYKDQAERFIEKFSNYTNVVFEICSDIHCFIQNSDVVISCITNASNLLTEPEWFKPGCLLVPVHTKGFQNCDLVFDKIFADDTAHVSNFQYFSRYKCFGELADVMQGKALGRNNDRERIISYNIGIALHDIVFSHHIIQLLPH